MNWAPSSELYLQILIVRSMVTAELRERHQDLHPALSKASRPWLDARFLMHSDTADGSNMVERR